MRSFAFAICAGVAYRNLFVGMGGRTTADAAEDGRDGDGDDDDDDDGNDDDVDVDDDVEKGAIAVVRGRGRSGGSTRPTIVVGRRAAAAAARWREGSMVSAWRYCHAPLRSLLAAKYNYYRDNNKIVEITVKGSVVISVVLYDWGFHVSSKVSKQSTLHTT